MTGKHLQCAGLFLAAFAAFWLALGQPRLALAASEKPAPSAEQVRAMLERLSPEQREALENKACLAAKMLAVGYSAKEIKGRLALLTPEEMVRLARNPEATTGGKFAGFLLAVAAVIIVALLITGYFVAVEEPPPPPEPPPAR